MNELALWAVTSTIWASSNPNLNLTVTRALTTLCSNPNSDLYLGFISFVSNKKNNSLLLEYPCLSHSIERFGAVLQVTNYKSGGGGVDVRQSIRNLIGCFPFRIRQEVVPVAPPSSRWRNRSRASQRATTTSTGATTEAPPASPHAPHAESPSSPTPHPTPHTPRDQRQWGWRDTCVIQPAVWWPYLITCPRCYRLRRVPDVTSILIGRDVSGGGGDSDSPSPRLGGRREYCRLVIASVSCI